MLAGNYEGQWTEEKFHKKAEFCKLRANLEQLKDPVLTTHYA